VRCIALLTLISAACGDNDSRPCLVEFYAGVFGQDSNQTSGECIAANRFAARDSPTITPSQEDVDRYFERWTRVVTAEPILRNRQPQKYRGMSSDLVAQIWTTNPAVVAAFSSSTMTRVDVPVTGDPVFDQIISELVRPQLETKGQDLDGDGEILFGVASSAQFNEELLHRRLLATSSRLDDPFIELNDDGTWTWPELGPGPGADDATAQIDFRFGWGDCFVSCVGFRDLRAIVPPSGRAMVFDLGGDPLPPELMLSPDTLPPP
jgi:hypothetical protein